jgi:hypothetical protein
MNGTQPAATMELMRLVRGGRVAQAISVAVRLGVADQIADAPRTGASSAPAGPR